MRKTGARLAGAMLLATTMVVPVSAANAQAYLQCVPFARTISGIDLFGRAASWWHQAVGRYEQGSLPRAGSVLVFRAISSMRSGHVATVSRVVSDRVIEVTHANWSIIRGRRGQIERNVEVVDVSPANDWSRVRVWWAPHQGLGTTNYPTYGFIYGDKASKPADMLSRPVLVTIRPPAPKPMWSITTASASLSAARPWPLLTASAQPGAKAASFARPAVLTMQPPAPRPVWPTTPIPVMMPPAPPAKPSLPEIALR